MEQQRSLEQIEGHAWGDPPAGATRLIETVHELRRRPVSELTVEDLRVLLGQQVGLDVLVPVALEVLAVEPLAEGDFFPGDLLSAMLRLPVDYWKVHAEWAARLRGIVAGVRPDEVDDDNLQHEILAFRDGRH
ncbi:contact-dependent growth inhibition system immunity protein [Paractinoplanes ferrugineus]|uniref:contact-dependent growth inhibition system immunity protein n=1 Tax=Paractinoplanes ferrugineus TaxID=113564 RepID=UPI001EF1DA16|nr:contact-dependent growth inhibition system immunity protein [Actinoplanes ferrugineus]